MRRFARPRFLSPLAALVLVTGMATALIPGTAGAARAHSHRAAVQASKAGGDPIFVSNRTHGSPTGGCSHPEFSTIGSAVAAAPAGGTVVVCPGTYREDVVVLKPLTLLGRFAVINAAGLPGAPIGTINGQAPYNGVTIESSNVTVKGFTVTGALGEGILAVNPNPVPATVNGMQFFTGTPLTGVLIEDNVVKGNDTGAANPTTSPYGQCQGSAEEPGDCGEGIHLMSVANSVVSHNQSIGNSGGILITDEFGPNHDNLIADNYVFDNATDCGITLPGHSLGFNPGTGKTVPSFGGVYDEHVTGNIVVKNGVKGFGAGIGVFAPFPGAASYDNTISGNFMQGNGLGGISVHSHAPDAYVDGNVFTHNLIGKNNVTKSDGGDGSPIDHQTTGIVIWSATTPYHFVVSNNRIFDNTYGVWLTPATISASGLSTNKYQGVKTPVFDAS